MIIFVARNKTTISVEVNPDDTVDALKKKICAERDEKSFPENCQVMKYSIILTILARFCWQKNAIRQII